MPRNLWSDEEIEALKSGKNFQVLAKRFDRSHSAVRDKAYRLGIHIGRHKFSINEDFFKSWSSEMAYVFGYWFADGNIAKSEGPKGSWRMSFTSKDRDILEKVKIAMGVSYYLYYAHRDNTYSLQIYSNHLVNDIIKLGGQPRKSLIAKFPKVPQEFVYDFIRGYWDGDGFIFLRHKNHNYPLTGCAGTFNFLTTIEKYLGQGKLYECEGKGGSFYNLMYSGERAQKVLPLLYHNASIFMDRKYDLYLKAMEWEPKRKPWSGEEINTLSSWGDSTAALARFLHRTYGSVHQKKRRLGLV